MNIYANEGDKVTYSGENGYESDRQYIENRGVKKGDTLEVSYTTVGSWMTLVKFKDVEGYHNSVMFEDVV